MHMEFPREKRIKKLVKKIGHQLCIQLDNVRIKGSTNPGDNWVGDCSRIEVSGYNKIKQMTQLALFVKMAPVNLAYRDLLNVSLLYNREIYFYTSIIPEMIKVQVENGVKKIFQPFAKYYTNSEDYLEEFIVLEDMVEKKFVPGNHREPVDYANALLIIKLLAKLHALSFALKKYKSEVYENIKSSLKENFFTTTIVSRMVLHTVLNLCNQIMSICEPSETCIKEAIQKFSEKLPSFYTTIVLAEESGPYNVICHGDTQIRNFMFKYGVESNSNIPETCCAIDMQISHVASPALDLFFFLFVSTDANFRRLHYKNIINIYYETFSIFLRELGGDPKELFPFSILQNHLKRCAPFGLYVAIWIVALNFKASEDVLSHDALSEESLIENFSTIKNKRYFTRIKELVLDMIKYEYNFVY